jgi:8-oxo-dGTP pyrophosphatase MutT (NUDIX family)
VARRLLRRPPRVVADGDGWRMAAVAAVFRDGAEGAELLFIQRAEHERDPWSGQIGFPGGRAEPGDADLLHTAARETREEIGLDLLDPSAATPLGALDELQARARARIVQMAIRPYAFVLRGPEPPPLQPNDEVAAAFWAPVSWLCDERRRAWYDSTRVGVAFRFPGIDLGPGRLLWGLTHRMVLEILHRLDLVDDVDRLSLPRPLATP